MYIDSSWLLHIITRKPILPLPFTFLCENPFFRLITFVYLPFKSTDFDMQLKDCVTKKERYSKKSHFANLLYNRILYSTFVTFIKEIRIHNKSFISSIFRSSFGCYQNKGGLISDLVFTLVSPSKQWKKSCSLNFSI